MEHTGIDAFGAGSGEAGFGNYVRLDVFEGERDGVIAIAFDVGDGFLVFVDAHGVLLVDVHAGLQSIGATENQGRAFRIGAGPFASADVELENGAIARGFDR